MVCIYCGSPTKVNNSRLQKRNNQIWRRRQCYTCGAVFTTNEAPDYSSSLMVETKQGFKSFEPDILFTEVLLALEHRSNCYREAREITGTVISKLLKLPGSPVFSPKQISNETLKVLKRFDSKAWHKYSAERSSP